MPEEPIEEQEPGEVFADRVREIRKALDWTQEELARRLIRLHGEPETDANVHTWRMVVTRTESRARKATIEDLLQFAAALGVSPVALLVPSGGAYLTIGQQELAPIVAKAWASGVLPLNRADVEAWWRFSRSTCGPIAKAELEDMFTPYEEPQPVTDDTREALLAYIDAQKRADEGVKDWAATLRAGDLKEQIRQDLEADRALRAEWEAAISRLPREEDESKPQQRKGGK